MATAHTHPILTPAQLRIHNALSGVIRLERDFTTLPLGTDRPETLRKRLVRFGFTADALLRSAQSALPTVKAKCDENKRNTALHRTAHECMCDEIGRVWDRAIAILKDDPAT